MKRQEISQLAFSKGTPSCFFVMSTFQLLCAIEAIKALEIEDYKIVFVLLQIPEFTNRNEQMRRMANKMELPYEEIEFGQFPSIQAKERYDRIFVGDYYALPLLQLSSYYATSNAVLLFTDDGNSSISILQGTKRDNRPSEWSKLIKWYKSEYFPKQKQRKRIYRELETQGLICMNCFFTIYSDIPSKKFVLFPNSFSHLSSMFRQSEEPHNLIVIVGAALYAYSIQNRIDEIDMEAITWRQLSQVRATHPNTEVLYIPHGRDTNPNVPEFCRLLHFTYRRIDETIECYLLQNGIIPSMVFGFNSSALFNLKKIYPSAKVTNWFIDKRFDNSYYTFFSSVRKYYEQNGIETTVIKFPDRTDVEKAKILLSNFMGLVKLALRKVHILSGENNSENHQP